MSRFTKTMFSRLYGTKTWVRTLGEHTALINLVMFALILIVGLLYIVQVNSSVTKGYEIRDLETRIDELRVESQFLETQVAENRSMAAVDERVKMMGMVNAPTAEFVDAGTPSVALNR